MLLKVVFKCLIYFILNGYLISTIKHWAGRVYNTFIEAVKLNALVACQRQNEKYEKNYPCATIDENGSLLYE